MTDAEPLPEEALRSQLLSLYARVRQPPLQSLAFHADRDGRRLPTSTLSDFLNGRTRPRWDTVQTFVRACDLYAQAHRIPLPAHLTDLERWHGIYRAFENAVDDAAASQDQHSSGAVRLRRRAVPAQLPPDTVAFTGRMPHLTGLDRLLPDNRPGGVSGRSTAVVISAIDGTAGVGKTALAVHWAHRVAARFPDGQLYVNLRGFDRDGQVMDPATAVRGFLDAFNVPPQSIPADPDAQAARYRSLLDGRRVLVLLDNARDSAQVRPLLPGTPTAMVVVTSRNQLTGLVAHQGAHPITIDLLAPDEARDLLIQRLGADRVAVESEAVDEIIRRCAGLPLALTLVAARAALRPHHTLGSLAAQLRDTQQRWQTLSADDSGADVRAVLSWSYRALTPAAAQLFRIVGLHPGPDIGAAAAASLTGIPLARLRPMLDELTRTHLIAERAPDRYGMHDLLRAYAAELALTTDSELVRSASTRRLLDHYLHTAHAAAQLLEQGLEDVSLPPLATDTAPERLADPAAALAWFAAELPVLLACVEYAAAAGQDVRCWQLAWSMQNYLQRQGRWQDQAAAARIAVAAAERLADPIGVATTCRMLARACTRLDSLGEADDLLRRALDLFTASGDKAGQAHVHTNYAFLCQRFGRPASALDHAEQALRLYENVGYRAGQARALNNVGWHYAQLGDHTRAVDYCRRALALHQELGYRYGEASTWDSLGFARHHLGDHAEAVTCYQRAITMFRDFGDRYYEAIGLDHLGDARRASGATTAARDAYERAAEILAELQCPEAEEIIAKLDTLPAPPPPDSLEQRRLTTGRPR